MVFVNVLHLRSVGFVCRANPNPAKSGQVVPMAWVKNFSVRWFFFKIFFCVGSCRDGCLSEVGLSSFARVVLP